MHPKKVTFFNGTPELEYDDEKFEELIALHKMNLEDYQHCWITSLWNIGGYQMCILKWQLGFKFEEDPLIVPIWVSLHELPLEWTHRKVLFSIASAVGKPLQVDTPTLNLTRPSVARFCGEVDLTTELRKSIRIGKKGKKYEQLYTYEYVPSYCSAYCKIGHKEFDCRKGKGVALNVLKADAKKAEHADLEMKTAGNKNGIRLQQKKVTWGSRKTGKSTDLQVEIIQENPLTVKGVESKVAESRPAETLARNGGSISGLFVKDKCVVPVDIVDSSPSDPGHYHLEDTVHVVPETRDIETMDDHSKLCDLNKSAPVSQANKFAILQDIDDYGDAVKTFENEDDNDDVENVFTEEHNDNQLTLVDKVSNNLVNEGLPANSLARMTLFLRIHLKRMMMKLLRQIAGLKGIRRRENAQREFSIKKKRGRNLKVEHAKLLDGKELRRSLRLQ
ncbi:OLC1v1024256C1 [Oldenlandia corymbosa var. corymbosa]|uniref:OLC1v1024256C1 n=1 Tax=Oldenlandia corymbosa var. corymbosa TaxID=529605 RepID=A0AAV1C1U6_OLDCO|nr:OLC1v1024256C1 [Oldenlandia corymbosa var. corymbosa]